MPMTRVDNQQSPIPRPLLVVRSTNMRSFGRRKPTWKERTYRSVRAITPDLLWTYIREPKFGRNALGHLVWIGPKYGIVRPHRWPKWLQARVKSEDLAAQLTGIELEPAWSEALEQRIELLERRADRKRGRVVERGRFPTQGRPKEAWQVLFSDEPPPPKNAFQRLDENRRAQLQVYRKLCEDLSGYPHDRSKFSEFLRLINCRWKWRQVTWLPVSGAPDSARFIIRPDDAEPIERTIDLTGLV